MQDIQKAAKEVKFAINYCDRGERERCDGRRHMFEKAKKRRVFHHGLDIAYSDLECSMRFVL